MRIGGLLFLFLVFASAYNVYAALKSRTRESEIGLTIRRVDSMLTVWAEHWGEPPDQVKAKLREALQGLEHKA